MLIIRYITTSFSRRKKILASVFCSRRGMHGYGAEAAKLLKFSVGDGISSCGSLVGSNERMHFSAVSTKTRTRADINRGHREASRRENTEYLLGEKGKGAITRLNICRWRGRALTLQRRTQQQKERENERAGSLVPAHPTARQSHNHAHAACTALASAG